MPAINLAERYAEQCAERFRQESYIAGLLNQEFDFNGVESVTVYNVPVVPMNDYTASGSNRYGTPIDLSRNKQTMTITRDRSFTFAIEKKDSLQTLNVMDAGKALARQQDEVVTPEFDAYCFRTLANKAIEFGNTDGTAITADNAYTCLLNANEKLSENWAPETGRFAFCTYRVANLLKQDTAFVMATESGQGMKVKGEIGEVDGIRIIKVPSSALPAGAGFLLVAGATACAPQQLAEYKIHDNPPGYSGWLIEGRYVYDCFVINEKAKGLFYHGSQAVLKKLNVLTSATAANKSTIVVPVERENATNKRYYMTATTAAGLTAVTSGSGITVANWTELTADSLEITPTSGHKFVRVVETYVSGSGGSATTLPIAVGDALINVG